MSTFNAFYVRKQGADDATKAAVAGLFPKADIQILPEFVGAVLSRDDIEPPEQKLQELSASLGTDVIWVTFQTTAESFIFHHWRAGEQLRALWYGCADEGVWGRAEGEAEPWEAEAFWSEEALEGALECAESESEQRKLRRLWKDRVIRKGQTDPSVSSEDAVHAVMEHYGLFAPNQTETTTSGDTRAAPVPVSTGVKGVQSFCLGGHHFCHRFDFLEAFQMNRTSPNQSPEPTAVGAVRSAVAALKPLVRGSSEVIPPAARRAPRSFPQATVNVFAQSHELESGR